ncbi:MAG: hypothetical protein HZB47_08700 [Nitrosomonadales bacterium]|nr:hypothetical protein [Nitrosomonadales bacterium]
MATFFGIDERNAQGYLDRHAVCLPHLPDGSADLHGIVSPIRHEDIVFIKQCTPQSSLRIKAVGVVQSDFPLAGEDEICLPVEWVWKGEKVLDNLDEVLSLCGEPLYEEHNITVQREIIDLLPAKYQLPPAW